MTLYISERRGSVSGGVSKHIRVGSGGAAARPPERDAIKVLFISDLHTLSRQQQLQLSLLLLHDTYSIPTVFLIAGSAHPLQSLRYSLRGKFRISASITSSQLTEFYSTNFVKQIEQSILEQLRSNIDERGTVEFCLELEAYVRDVAFGLRNHPDGTYGSVRFPASTLKALSRCVACIAGREFVVPEDVNDAASLFLPLAFRSSQVQITDILHV